MARMPTTSQRGTVEMRVGRGSGFGGAGRRHSTIANDRPTASAAAAR